MRRAVLLAMCLLCLAGAAESHAAGVGGKVKRLDGLRAQVLTGKRVMFVRPAGVVLPGPGRCYARGARRWARRLIGRGKRVRVVGVRRGRGYFVVGRRDVGQRLVDLGAVRVRGRFSRRRAYLRAERRARSRKRGLWSCAAPAPGGGPLAPGAPAVPPRSGGTGSDPLARPFDIGNPALDHLWVDPVAGSDTASGRSRSAPLRSVDEAWRRIPRDRTLTRGVQIDLLPGDYPPESLPNYWEARHGTRAAPVIVKAVDGPASVRLAPVNLYDVRYVYFLSVRFDTGGDIFHCERCDHVLIRGSRLMGRDPASPEAAHENIKVNQSTSFFLEDSEVYGAEQNLVDFVSVQGSHLLNNKLHGAADWCAYVKGGSAHARVARNEIYDCDTGGFLTGQGTGFQYMASPWLHYETYDVKVYDNYVHDTIGPGLGANGAYDTLFAHNTLVETGRRSHVLEVSLGGRSCDGPPEEPSRALCTRNRALGGWGSNRPAESEHVRIPNRNVWFFNNLIANRTPSTWSHFSVEAPYSGSGQAGSGLGTVRSDDGLRVAGNVIWNGPAAHSLGLRSGESQVRGDNAINTVDPRVDAQGRPGAALPAPRSIPSFPAWEPPAPPGRLVNDDLRRASVGASLP